jgi:hypothetical protein
VKTPPYSSLTAFLAHLGALRSVAASTPEQTARLAEMEAAVARLAPAERDALESGDDTGAPRRHRERAARHLIQILREQGSLAG